MGSELTGPSDSILTIHVGSQVSSVGQGKRTFYEKWSVTIVILTLLIVTLRALWCGAGSMVRGGRFKATSTVSEIGCPSFRPISFGGLRRFASSLG